MKLTPLDLRKQDFTRVMRGYDPDEVQAFLQMLSEQWEDVLATNRRLEDRVRTVETKLEHYERVEEALQEALHTARENKEQILQNAKREAEVTLKEAEARADEITREARTDRDRFRGEAERLEGRRSEIVARLRAFLLSEMELLARFEGEDPIGFIQLLPAEERERLRQGASADLNALAKDQRSSSKQKRSGQESKAARSSTSDASEEEDLPDYLDRFATPEGEEDAPAAVSSASEARPRPAPDPEAAEEEQEQDNPGWIVNALFAADDVPEGEAADVLPRPAQTPEDEEDIVPTSEEIEKIRRILNDMDS